MLVITLDIREFIYYDAVHEHFLHESAELQSCQILFCMQHKMIFYGTGLNVLRDPNHPLIADCIHHILFP